ncbi:hypothetical protein ACFSNA_02625 [Pedobacter mendelii]|uniref:hypothetical protein n=1 Tax=Pedobacter mendelii TaxID=1908240 RepID=UPI003609A748
MNIGIDETGNFDATSNHRHIFIAALIESENGKLALKCDQFTKWESSLSSNFRTISGEVKGSLLKAEHLKQFLQQVIFQMPQVRTCFVSVVPANATIALIDKHYQIELRPDKPKGMTPDEYVNAQVKSILNPWMVNFLRFQPEDYIRYVKCPVLALNGSKDLQVLAKENLPEWKRILEESGNTNVTIKELPNINHLFQTADTGLPEEYKKINESFSTIAMKEMTSWMKIHIK